MKLEKKIVIEIANEERNVLRELVCIIEKAFNRDIEESPEEFTEMISGICMGYSEILTEAGKIEIEYNHQKSS